MYDKFEYWDIKAYGVNTFISTITLWEKLYNMRSYKYLGQII